MKKKHAPFFDFLFVNPFYQLRKSRLGNVYYISAQGSVQF